MTEQNPNSDATDDTEGHMRHRIPGADDVEGLDSMEDDVQGHVRTPRLDTDDEDDVEGHVRLPRLDTDDDDDVEGHSRAR